MIGLATLAAVLLFLRTDTAAKLPAVVFGALLAMIAGGTLRAVAVLLMIGLAFLLIAARPPTED